MTGSVWRFRWLLHRDPDGVARWWVARPFTDAGVLVSVAREAPMPPTPVMRRDHINLN